MDDCCNHNCDQGRTCPNRIPTCGKGYALIAALAAVAFAILCLVVIAALNPPNY